MHLGSAWYPEHWPESRWPIDLELMQAAHFTVARVGEYAWSRLEPAEGKFDLDWLDRVVTLAGRSDIHIVLCTPSDAPPAWLTQSYPETLRVAEDGRPTTHGGRRHFCPASPKYRELADRIAGVLAERFANHPNVVGWQVGNEFCAYSYDPITHRQFQEWLRHRYGTLAELNHCWTTAYWSQEYTAWDQVPLPMGWHNPCLVQAFFHFQSDTFRQFQLGQIRAIRKHAGNRQWITHNIHNFEGLDFVKIIADADLASWDPYPGGSGKIDYPRFGFPSDFCRTLKARRHWVMEAQPGLISWASPNLTLPRGAVRAMCWHFIGHGAEAVLFWQWRAPLGGQEQYHGTLLGPDGKPRPWFGEVARFGEELRKTESVLDGTHVEASVGLLYSYADQVAIQKQPHHIDFVPLRHTHVFYAPLRAMAYEVDVIDPAKPFEPYLLLVAPHLHILTDALIAKLKAYVEGGGHLLLGPRSGFKDEHNAMLPSRQPGVVLADLLGADVEEFYTLNIPVRVTGKSGEGTAMIWAETLTPSADDVEVLLTYGRHDGWLDNRPAMVTRRVGKGRISYLGAWLDPKLMTAIMAWAAGTNAVPVHFSPAPPPSVEVCRQVGDGREIFVIINHGDSPARITLPAAMTDVLTNQTDDSIELSPSEVRVFTAYSGLYQNIAQRAESSGSPTTGRSLIVISDAIVGRRT